VPGRPEGDVRLLYRSPRRSSVSKTAAPGKSGIDARVGRAVIIVRLTGLALGDRLDLARRGLLAATEREGDHDREDERADQQARSGQNLRHEHDVRAGEVRRVAVRAQVDAGRPADRPDQQRREREDREEPLAAREPCSGDVRPDQNRDGEADGDEVHAVEVHDGLLPFPVPRES